MNIFYVKRVIYFHFKKGIQSTGSLPSCNCKHIIRNCNNDLNVKTPHLLPRLLFAARILPFCIFLNKNKQKKKEASTRSQSLRPAGRRQLASICLDTLPSENRATASHMLLGNDSYIVLTPEQCSDTASYNNKDQNHSWEHLDKSGWSLDDTQDSFLVSSGERDWEISRVWEERTGCKDQFRKSCLYVLRKPL